MAPVCVARNPQAAIVVTISGVIDNFIFALPKMIVIIITGLYCIRGAERLYQSPEG